MKRLFLSRISAVLGLACLLQPAAPLFAADSPASIAGQTFDTVVTGANGGYANSGSYRFILGEDGKYVAYATSGNVGDVAGNYVYQRVSVNAGQMSFNDAIRPGYVQTFTYNTTNTGSFVLGNLGFPGSQRGNFRSYNGTAPSNGGTKVFTVQNANGGLNFAGRSSFRIVTRSNDFTVQDISGRTNLFSGTFAYTRQTKSSGIMQFTDAANTNRIAILTFENGTQGSLFIRHTNRLSTAGTFTMAKLKAPAFAKQPLPQNIAVGERVEFIAAVTGTHQLSAFAQFASGRIEQGSPAARAGDPAGARTSAVPCA